MKKRVALILIILLVLTVIAGGVAYYVRRNTGARLLTRVELSIRASQYDEALKLAADYTRKNPDDWHGYYAQGRALMLSGRFVDARQPLQRATELNSGHVGVRLLLADTHALPARKALADPRTLDSNPELRKAIDELQQARQIVPLTQGAGQDALDAQEYVGLNLKHAGQAHDALAARLRKEAGLAGAAGSQSMRDEKQRDANVESAAAEREFAAAQDILLGVVRNDASRDTAGSELVGICIRRGDANAIEATRRTIFAIDEANRPPLTTAALVLHSIPTEGSEVGPAERKDKLDAAAKTLDGLLARHPNQEEVLLARAQVALMQSDASTASDLSQRVLKLNPRNPVARLYEAKALVLRRNLPEAERTLFGLVTEYRGWWTARLAYGEVLAELPNKKEAARAAMVEVVNLNPTNWEAGSKLVEWSRRDGLYQKAYDAAETLYEARPKDMAALLLLATAAKDANQFDFTKVALSETRQKHPDEPEFLVAVAQGYTLLGDTKQAAEVANQAADSNFQTAASRFARVQAVLMTDRPNRLAVAEAELTALISEQAQPARAHVTLAQVLWQGQRRMDALEHYRKAAALEEKNVTYRVRLAQALLDVGQLDESVQECHRVLDLDADNPFARMILSQTRVIRGEDPSEAFATTQPGSGNSGVAAALAYLGQGQPDRCIDICQAELKRSPDDRDLRLLLAQAFAQAGKTEQSLEEWKALVKADPDQVRYYLGIVALWRRDSSLADVEKALVSLPNARRYVVDLIIGDMRLREKDLPAAAAAYRRAASSEGGPDDIRGRARLQAANCLSAAGQPEAALAELDALGTLKGWQTQAVLRKAEVLHAAHRSGEAKAVLDGLRKSVEAAGDWTGLASVAQAYAAVDCLQDSLAVCDVVQRSLPNDSRPCLLRAGILSRANRQAELQECYRKAIELAPANLDIYQALARSLESGQDIPGALEVLRKMASAGGAGATGSLVTQAGLYARQGLYQPAIRCLKEALAQGSAEDPAVKLQLGQFIASLGQPQEAAAVLQTVPRYSRQYVTSQQLLAELAETEDAKLSILRRLATEMPASPGVLSQQMSVLLQSGRTQESADLFAKFAAGRPSPQALPGDAASLAVQSLWESGKRREAADLCSRMAKDTHMATWRCLAALLLDDQDRAAARSLLSDPNTADALDGVLGTILWREETATARTWQARAEPRTDPPSQAGAPAVARFLSSLAIGDTAKAEGILAKAPPGSFAPRAAFDQLVAYAKDDPNASAVATDLLKAVLVRDKNIGQLSIARSWALNALKDRPDCQYAATLVLSTGPDEATLKTILDRTRSDSIAALEARAVLLLRQRKHAEAAETFGQLAARRKDEPELMIRQGTALEQAGRLDQALAIYQDVLKLRKDPVAANNAAYLLSLLYPKDISRLKEAMTFADQAIALLPTEGAFHDTKGWIAYLLGQNEVACRELRQAMPGRPDSAAVHYHLGMAESRAGSAEMARLHLEAAVALSIGLPADKLASLDPATVRAGESAKESLKTLEPPKP